ncbi:DMT family transporter [Oscillochloris sp. ZM17-4]|uniref:DMT family transporter n=1 Tax=Oscillochloris sp. ZM17-4 TaxID=2866714 RepID=UPI001C72E504|nr:DMT family transporter [Oscillochloris sp. ZM17-4]
MGVIFGLLAALGWGSGDFLISRAARAIGPIQAMLYIQLVGIAALGALLLARRDLPPTELRAWGLGVAANMFNLGGTMLLYRAFSIGSLSIVSPIAASFAVVTIPLALLGGERPGALALAGAALVVGGVVVVSRGHGGEGGPPRGVPEAIGAACCIGLYFWSVGFATPLLGTVWPVLLGRAIALLAALGVMLARGGRPAPVPAGLWPTLIAASLLDTAAFIFYNIGISSGYVSVVSALASIFSAVTVLMAWVFLRERLRVVQWAGVAGLIVGVFLASVGA